MKPYAVTVAPFIGATEVKIVRTADKAVIHCALHAGGIERGLRIANKILDRETGIDTSIVDTGKAPERERVSLIKAPQAPKAVVSLRRSPLDLTRLLVTRLHP